MTSISEHIEGQFYKVLKQKTSIKAFEKWLYEEESLEKELSSSLYLKLGSV